MGFVSEELNETEKQLIKGSKASNMAVVYGKEASIWKVSTGPGSPHLQDLALSTTPGSRFRNVPTDGSEKRGP